MDLSGNYINNDFDLLTRRLRLISDIMVDYQSNIRQMIQLLTNIISVTNNNTSFENSSEINQNAQGQPLRTRVMQQEQRNRYQNRSNNTNNNLHQQSQTSNTSNQASSQNGTGTGTRRGFIYTQFIEPPINQQNINFELQYSDNINQGLTNEQIQNCTQIVQYDASMSEMRCPISWDLFDTSHNIVKINRCGHIFGESALISWFQNNNRCPVCRACVNEPANTNDGTQTNEDNDTIYTNAINTILSRFLSNYNANENYGYYDNDINDLTDFYSSLINTQSFINTNINTNNTNTNNTNTNTNEQH